MADYAHRITRVTRHAWVLPSPTPVAELHKAFAAAGSAWEGFNGRAVADDALRVEACDDEIVVFFDVEELP
jgi:hypothetical protein